MTNKNTRTITVTPRKFQFSATSTEPKTTPLVARGHKAPSAPTVYYAQKAWDKIWHIIEACEKEVGWLGLVESLEDGSYLITDVFVPPQTVSSVETDISADALAQFALDLLDEGADTSQLFYWGHSHVDMAVIPSGQDEDQVDEFLEHQPVIIRGIYNKAGLSKVDVFDATAGVVHQCVGDYIYTPGLSNDETAELNKTLRDNITERTYTPALAHGAKNKAVKRGKYGYPDPWAKPSWFRDEELSALNRF